jgi:SAM-dependent methyltransferase
MPGLKTKLHVSMLNRSLREGQIERDGIYGMHWGDPDRSPQLRMVRDNYLYPFINPDHAALEIGQGGGRWTRYLLSFGSVTTVDFYQPVIDEFARQFRAPHLRSVRNNGTDFPEIAAGTIDFVWSFGTFVHLEPNLIRGYLASMPRILAPGANVVIHYSDKRKPQAQRNHTFSDNDPVRMRAWVEEAGFAIASEDTDSLGHSAIMRFQLR